MEERVAADPLDADAWVVLLAEACDKTAIDYRPLFERCVTHFPSAACVWYQWLEAELRTRQMEVMESIFERCLLQCPHVELWRLYLRFLRTEKRSTAKELQSAYELLLEAVGTDVRATGWPTPTLCSRRRALLPSWHMRARGWLRRRRSPGTARAHTQVGSGGLWIEYVALLKAQVEPGMMPMSGAVTNCRDAFQRALVQPAAGLEALWTEYEAWEGVQSGGNAKAMLVEITDKVCARLHRECSPHSRAL